MKSQLKETYRIYVGNLSADINADNIINMLCFCSQYLHEHCKSPRKTKAFSPNFLVRIFYFNGQTRKLVGKACFLCCELNLSWEEKKDETEWFPFVTCNGQKKNCLNWIEWSPSSITSQKEQNHLPEREIIQPVDSYKYKRAGTVIRKISKNKRLFRKMRVTSMKKFFITFLHDLYQIISESSNYSDKHL